MNKKEIQELKDYLLEEGANDPVTFDEADFGTDGFADADEVFKVGMSDGRISFARELLLKFFGVDHLDEEVDPDDEEEYEDFTLADVGLDHDDIEDL